MKPLQIIQDIKNSYYDDTFNLLYGNDSLYIDKQKERYINAITEFMKIYPQHNDVEIYSASGRTEIGGNHTDHQYGCVLAGAVNLDNIAVVSFNNDNVIRLKSEGYVQNHIDLYDLSIKEDEKGKSSGLVRGIVSKFNELGIKTEGFDAYVASNVLSGSGLSSSAAFEVLIGTIIDSHYNNNQLGAIEIAKIGQFSENQYFGKKSGLMDQMVSSVGGFVFIDFKDIDNPYIEKISCDFSKADLQLYITDTKGSHENLTDDYVAIPMEMNSVAEYFGKSHLREVNESDFYKEISNIKKVCSDRAILRAAHFFNDNRNAGLEAEALSNGNISRFLELVNQSGNSSAKWLQNLYSNSHPAEQGITLGLLISEKVLDGRGAARVHGGGFAGTIQAFVPSDLGEAYKTAMDNLFGEGSCYCLNIRQAGGIKFSK